MMAVQGGVGDDEEAYHHFSEVGLINVVRADEGLVLPCIPGVQF